MNNKLVGLSILVFLAALSTKSFALTIPTEPSREGAINFVGLVSVFIDLIWIIFVVTVVILLIVTAFLFLTTQGDPEKSKKARMALIFSIIGIVVALLGYRIYATINGLVISNDLIGPPPPPPPQNQGTCCLLDQDQNPTVCQVLTQADCAGSFGNYLGGPSCDPNPCQAQ